MQGAGDPFLFIVLYFPAVAKGFWKEILGTGKKNPILAIHISIWYYKYGIINIATLLINNKAKEEVP